MPEALDSLKIRSKSKARFTAIGGEWRMNNLETFDALLDGWDSLTDEQKVEVIRRQPESGTPRARRSKVPA